MDKNLIRREDGGIGKGAKTNVLYILAFCQRGWGLGSVKFIIKETVGVFNLFRSFSPTIAIHTMSETEKRKFWSVQKFMEWILFAILSCSIGPFSLKKFFTEYILYAFFFRQGSFQNILYYLK